MLGMFLNQAIDLAAAVAGNAKEVVGESAGVVVHLRTLGPKRLAHLIAVLFSHIGLKQHLQGQFARFAPFARLSGHRKRSASACSGATPFQSRYSRLPTP